MNFNRFRTLACNGLALLALLALPAFAQYPTKPIRLVVGFPAGGGTDLVARSIAGPMSQALGQPVVIDNKAGVDGILATDIVAKAAPDGYTILFANASAFSYAPAARKSLPFDPVADFTPIGQLGDFGYFVYVHPALPVRDLKEFVSYAQANRGKLNHGMGNATSLLLSSALAQSQKLEFLQVPYKGEAPLLLDLLSARVDFAVASGTYVPRVKDGKLRAIATFLPARSPLLPDVQTFAEAGLTPPAITVWTGLVGPARMPPEIVQRLSRALATALGSPEVRERFAGMAGHIQSSSPEQFGALMKQQLGAWGNAARAAGVQPE